MNEEERYLFDLHGYVVLRGVLDAGEVRAANAAIDAERGRIAPRATSLAEGADALRGSGRRHEATDLLAWSPPRRAPLVSLLAHPRLTPILHALVGNGFRLDHAPLLVCTPTGTEGHLLHGGSGPHFDPSQYYLVQNHQIHCALLMVEWALTDVGPDDGGLCVIPGSHKSAFACPREIRRLEHRRDCVRPVPVRAGDVVVFTEALTHGTLPWRAPTERRAMLLRYAPANLAYARPPTAGFDTSDLPRAVRAVLEPPYHLHLDRPTQTGSGSHESWK